MSSSASIEIGGVEYRTLIVSRGGRSASLANADGWVIGKKTFQLRDPQGKINPFADTGALNGTAWADLAVEQTESSLARFTGTVAGMAYRSDGRVLEIEALERLGVFLDFIAETGDVWADAGDGFSVFTTAAAAEIGENRLTLTGTGGEIPKGAFVSFGAALAPRYQIADVSGSPNTTRIDLDRPLSAAVAAGTYLRILVAAEKTPSEEIRDALQTAGFDTFDSTWDTLQAADEAAGNYLRLLVRAEQMVKVRDHLARLMELGNLSIVNRPDGRLTVFRGLRYAGGALPSRQVTRAEILPPWNWKTVKTRLFAGYSVPYRDGETVALLEYAMTQAQAERWKSGLIWKPIDAQSSLVSEYQYLYANLTAATNLAESYFADYKAPVYLFTAGLKGFPAGKPWAPFGWNVGDQVLLSAPDGSGGRNFEPARVWELAESETRGRYQSITFLLTNHPDGLYDLDQPQLERPVALRLFAIPNGCAFTTPTIAEGASIAVEVWDLTGQNLIAEVTVTRGAGIETNGATCDLVQFSDPAIVNGLPHYFKARAVYGIYQSPRTNLTQFVPGAGSVSAGQYTCEWVT